MTPIESKKQEMILQLLLMLALHEYPIETINQLCDNYGYWKDFKNEGKNMAMKK